MIRDTETFISWIFGGHNISSDVYLRPAIIISGSAISLGSVLIGAGGLTAGALPIRVPDGELSLRVDDIIYEFVDGGGSLISQAGGSVIIEQAVISPGPFGTTGYSQPDITVGSAAFKYFSNVVINYPVPGESQATYFGAHPTPRWVYRADYFFSTIGSTGAGMLWAGSENIAYGIRHQPTGSLAYGRYDFMAGTFDILQEAPDPTGAAAGSRINFIIEKLATTYNVYYNEIISGSKIFSTDAVLPVGSFGFFFGNSETIIENFRWQPRFQLGSAVTVETGADEGFLYISGQDGAEIHNMDLRYN